MTGYSHGMNTDTVRELASQIDSTARELRSIDAAIERVMADLSHQWDGPDCHRFRSWWRDEHRPEIHRVVDAVEGLARSARFNADDQDKASGVSGAGGSAPGNPGSGVQLAPPDVAAPTPNRGVAPAGRAWQDVQKEYDAWAHGRFADPNESQYQCTGWANFRWNQLGYKGEIIGGNGGAMAATAGPTSPTPSLHAMASYGAGTQADYGHVMIVEEVSADGARIRVSEMNFAGGDPAEPRDFRDKNWITRDAEGVFRSWNGKPISFARFPG